MPHAALWVVQRRSGSSLVLLLRRFNAARGFVGGAAFLTVLFHLKPYRFNAARGFVGGAA